MAAKVRNSNDYLWFTLSEKYGQDITGDTVQVALLERPTDTPVWMDAVYDSGRQSWRTANIVDFSTANYPSWRYYGRAKVSDTPEIPWVDLGVLSFE